MKMKLSMIPEGLGHFNSRKQRRCRIPLVQLQGDNRGGSKYYWGYCLGIGNIPKDDRSAFEFAKEALLRALEDVQRELNRLSDKGRQG